MLVSIYILCFHNILLQHRRKSMGKMFYQRVSFGTMVKAECIDWVQVDGFRVWWQLRCKIYIRGEAAPTSLKAAMRGQGLVTCDQGLGGIHVKISAPRFCQFLGGFAARGFRLRYVLTLIQDTRRFYFLCAALPPLLLLNLRNLLPKCFAKSFQKKCLTDAPSIGILHKSVNH